MNIMSIAPPTPLLKYIEVATELPELAQSKDQSFSPKLNRDVGCGACVCIAVLIF
jgi:hypothetical protein